MIRVLNAAWLTLLLLIGVLSGSTEAVSIRGEVDLVSRMQLDDDLDMVDQPLAWETGLTLELTERFPETDIEFVLDATSGTGDLSLELSEAAVTLYGDRSRVVAGKQTVVWGTAADINPTSVINPVDPTTVDFEEKPVNLVQATRYLDSGLELTGVWIPAFVPAVDRIPGTPTVNVPKPEATLANSEGAVQVTYRGVGYDLSAMAFSGYDDMPSVKVTPGGPVGEYERVTTVGGSAATGVGDVGLWAEGVYTLFVDDEDDADSHQVVLGGDYTTTGGYYFMGQYHVLDRSTTGNVQHVITAVEKDFGLMNVWRVGSIYNLDNGSISIRPEVEISLSDTAVLQFEGVWQEEEEEGLGLPSPASQIATSLRVSF